MSDNNFLTLCFFGLGAYCLCYLIVIIALIRGRRPPPQP